MNLLLDTHVLLWWFDDSRRLGSSTRTLLEQPDTRIWISAISVWEISIKTSLNRLKIPETAEEKISSYWSRAAHPSLSRFITPSQCERCPFITAILSTACSSPKPNATA